MKSYSKQTSIYCAKNQNECVPRDVQMQLPMTYQIGLSATVQRAIIDLIPVLIEYLVSFFQAWTKGRC